MIKLKHIAWLALLLTGWRVSAQSNMTGTDNIVQHGELEWKYVATEYFDVHYHVNDPVMATVAARYAEEALWDLSQRLDYKNRSRFSLYIFMSPTDHIHSAMYETPNNKEGGVTPIRTNSAQVVFPGTYRGLERAIRTKVTGLLIDDYYYGGGIQASIQNTVLLHLPDWYFDGLTAYLGEGWTYADELWISGLLNRNLLHYGLEGDEYINHIARKSIWYFIASQYGSDKLSEIFYMTRLTRSVEEGIVHVLGITLKTLTERWREFILQRITENSTFRDKADEQAQSLPLPGKGRITGFALHPSEPTAAVAVIHDGRQTVRLYDLGTGAYAETGIEGGFRTDQYEPFPLRTPMAWSPNGDLLLSTAFHGGEEKLAWYNHGTADVTYTAIRPRLDRILDFSWSHDGRQLVASGMRMGATDLYRFTPGSAGFVQLTNDSFDDLSPVFSRDDQRIYYASTRPNDSIRPEEVRFDANSAFFDLWEYSLEDKALRKITHTPIGDEFPVAAISSFELLVRSDNSGIYNLYTYNAFLGDSVTQSNIGQGMYRAGLNDSLVAFTMPDHGLMRLWYAPRDEFLRESVVMKSQLRLAEEKELFTTQQNEALKKRLDSLKKELDERKKALEDTARKERETQQDSVEEAEEGVKYYVFDEEDRSEKQREKRRNRNRRQKLIRKKPVKPDYDELTVGRASRSSNRWAADRVTTQFGYDPVFKLSLLLEARLRDVQGGHSITVGFRPYVDFKSSDAYLRYLNTKHRLDWYAGLRRSTRFLDKLEFSTRYNATRLDGGVVYPLNRFLSVGGGLHATWIERTNMMVLIPKDIDGTALAGGARINLTYDKTIKNRNYIRSGTRATVDVSNSYNVTAGESNFISARFDLRKYLPVKRFLFATRLTGGWSAGPHPQQFFMGGTDEWLFSHFANAGDFPIEDNISDFHYMNYITPVHGFQFNARNGSKYFLANAELRIPLSRLFKSSLNSNPLYNIELIPFFDFGTTWSQGNPLSQRNPIDTETIDSYPLTITVQTLKSPFIMGFGGGARLMLFGYSMRFDLGWGVEDYTLLNPRLHLSLGKNF